MTITGLMCINRLFMDLTSEKINTKEIVLNKLDLFAEKHSQLASSLNHQQILGALRI